jgi:hypothetical protein
MCQETRKCNKCGKSFPLTENYFTRNQSTNTGGDKYFRPDCKECNQKMTKGRTKAYNNAGKPKHPDYGYNSKTKKTENGYPCDNCGRTSYSKRIVFDHDHDNLSHRGWLCDGCNRSIGMLGDDIYGLCKALSYTTKVDVQDILIFIKEQQKNGNKVITG